MSSLSRSVYLSRLRRAFLLRVHPDRFRNQPDKVRGEQASLVKALTARFSDDDFVGWQHGRTTPPSLQKKASYRYRLERRDGSFLSTKLELSESVGEILASMTLALEQSGVASLPKPPSEAEMNRRMEHLRQHSVIDETLFGDTIDHRQFDVVSRQGRDLWYFLQNLSNDEVQRRRASRTDAQAAAGEVRRVYSFVAVDATPLGWSSASVATLLNKLLALHEEFANKLHVESFYPVRLVFTSDDFHTSLDLYSGVLRLNPALTPLQWLEKLQLVTEDKLEMIRNNAAALQAMTKIVQSSLGVKLRKGHSCSSQEYFYFVERLASGLIAPTEEETMASDLIIEPITAVVEASAACRRPKVTKDGAIRLGGSMVEDEVRLAVARLAGEARQQSIVSAQERERCKDAVHQVQWQLGLQRVYRTSTVNNRQFLDCLSRILMVGEKQQLKGGLTGNSLGIASSGQFCHLADDGSVIIPFDWQ